MKEFTSKNLKELREDLNAVLEVVAEQHNISLSLANISFSHEEFQVKLTGIVANETGKIVQPFEKAYTSAMIINPQMKPLGTEFEYKGETFTIIGWKPKSPKYPLLGKNTVNGKVYKFGRSYAMKYKS